MDHLKFLLIVNVIFHYKLTLFMVGLLFASVNISTAYLQSWSAPAMLQRLYIGEGFTCL